MKSMEFVFVCKKCKKTIRTNDPIFYQKEYQKEYYEVNKKIRRGSFNHNPIYRFNRFLHFLRGQRTLGTLKRMPNINTIYLVKHIFKNVEVSYFGIFSFIAPLLKPMMPPETIARIINKLDILFPFLRRYSFKIVIEASK